MKVKVAKWGNSLGVRLPRAAVEATGIVPGADLDVIVEGGELRLKQSTPIKRYRLEDMIAEMDRLGPRSRPKLVDWGPDLGAEIIDDDYSRKAVSARSRGSGVGRSKTRAGTRTGRSKAGRRTLRP